MESLLARAKRLSSVVPRLDKSVKYSITPGLFFSVSSALQENDTRSRQENARSSPTVDTYSTSRRKDRAEVRQDKSASQSRCLRDN